MEVISVLQLMLVETPNLPDLAMLKCGLLVDSKWVNMSVTMLHSLRLNVTYNICVRDKALRVRQPVSCVITTWTLTTSHLSLQLSAKLLTTHHCATLLAARSLPST
jgi:hypothetical protein